MILLTIIVGFCTLVLFYFYVFHRRNRGLSKFPGPPKNILVGNASEFRSTTGTLDSLLKLTRQYGGIMYLRIGPIIPSLVLSDVKSVSWILGSTKHIEKSRVYRFLRSWLGTGLLTSGGEKWRQRRKILTPTFHFKILENFIDVFNRVGNTLVDKMQKEVGKDSFDVYNYMTLCTLDIICETAMGTSVNAQKNENSEYVTCVKEMCMIVAQRNRSPVKNIDLFYRFSKDYRIEQRAVKVLHNYTDSVINKRRGEMLQRKNTSRGVEENVGIKEKSAFLDLLLRTTYPDGTPLSDLDIREEVDTFMFEGHDTTASAITFALYNLAKYPQVQDRVVAELKQIFSNDPKRRATYADLQEMKYLEMVIKESLRMYPSVFMVSRELQDDVALDGKVIPKCTTITIFIYGLHRDPVVYPEPEIFDPERFAEGNSVNRSPYAYIPFSAGSRNCIGQKFAMLEMKATISKVLRNFEILPAISEHKLALVAEIILKSANGVRIRVKPRNGVQ